MKFDKVHCLFEQSGTFKGIFINLGHKAYDYDILNDFGKTDFTNDLFKEIHQAYKGEPSIFDTFSQDDLILAFFPCVRFEVQIIMGMKGHAYGMDKWPLERKLENSMKLVGETYEMYCLVTELVMVCLRKKTANHYREPILHAALPHPVLAPRAFVNRQRPLPLWGRLQEANAVLLRELQAGEQHSLWSPIREEGSEEDRGVLHGGAFHDKPSLRIQLHKGFHPRARGGR